MKTTPMTALSSIALLSLGACASLGADGEKNGTDPDDLDSTAIAVSCPDSPADDLFDSAICICEDFDQVGQLLVGTNTGDPAVVGVNGLVNFVNQAEIRGDLHAFGGYDTVTATTIDGDLTTAGDATMVAALSVAGDLEAGGDLSSVGFLTVGGELRVAGQTDILGPSDIGGVGAYGTTPDQPCNCDPSTFFDVAGAVADAAASNDNAAINIGTKLSQVGVNRLDLGSGSYYFDEFATVGDTQILIDGAVAIHIEGDLQAVGNEVFLLTDGSTLDLFVSGSVQTVGNAELGDPGDPAAFRLYIGGADSVSVGVGRTRFNGAIYAPEATLAYVGDTEIRGAVFARELAGVGRMTLGYAAPEDGDGQDCPEPGDDDGPDDDGEGPIVQ